MGRQPLSVTVAFDHNLVAGVGQPVPGTVAQNGIIEQPKPLRHRPVAGNDEAGPPVPADDEFVQVAGLRMKMRAPSDGGWCKLPKH